MEFKVGQVIDLRQFGRGSIAELYRSGTTEKVIALRVSISGVNYHYEMIDANDLTWTGSKWVITFKALKGRIELEGKL